MAAERAERLAAKQKALNYLNLKMSLGLGVFLLGTTASAHFSSDCPKDVLREVADSIFFIHDAVTIRPYQVCLNDLNDFQRRFIAGAVPIAPFEPSEFIEGKKSLLSLGEGGSDFIGTMLQKQMERPAGKNLGNLHAVDVIFDPQSSPDAIYADYPLTRRRVTDYLRRYPENYHAQLFQDLNILNSDGSPKLFDEIVSLGSLGYVVAHAEEKELLGILSKIAQHLNSGGNVRITDVELNHEVKVKLRRAVGILISQGQLKGIYLGSDGNVLIKK